MEPAKEAAHKAEYPARRRAAFDTPFGIAGYPPPVKSALGATEQERLRAYDAKWAEGGSISYLYSFTDLLLNKKANGTASEFVRRKIRATVKDPKTAELLCPNDHPIGTKRSDCSGCDLPLAKLPRDQVPRCFSGGSLIPSSW